MFATVTSPFYGPKIFFTDRPVDEWEHPGTPSFPPPDEREGWEQASGVELPKDGQETLKRIWVIEPGELRHFYRTPTQCWRSRYQAVKGLSEHALDLDSLTGQDRYKSHSAEEKTDFKANAKAFLFWNDLSAAEDFPTDGKAVFVHPVTALRLIAGVRLGQDRDRGHEDQAQHAGVPQGDPQQRGVALVQQRRPRERRVRVGERRLVLAQREVRQRDLEEHELDDCRVADVAKRLEKPWMTVDRTLRALHVLQLLKCVNVDKIRKQTGEDEGSVERKTVG